MLPFQTQIVEKDEPLPIDLLAPSPIAKRERTVSDVALEEWDKNHSDKVDSLEKAHQEKVEKEIATQESKKEQSLSVEHFEYADLENEVKKRQIGLKEFIDETKAMSKVETEEGWRAQYDAIQNLRILNKFYPDAFDENIVSFPKFVKEQITNLRSSNARNAIQLFLEIFMSRPK